MKKILLAVVISVSSLFGVGNHFVGILASSGKLEDPSVNLDDDSYVSFGIKTGLLTDNVMVYMDYQHFTFSIESDNKNYNEDLLSLGLGPVFTISEDYDISFYVNGVAVVDKFHYSEEILKDKYNEYLSQYQLFLGYEFGLIFPVRLNPFHNRSDSFFEFGYRQVYRNDSVLDSVNRTEMGENGEEDIEPFKGMNAFFMGLNFLF